MEAVFKINDPVSSNEEKAAKGSMLFQKHLLFMRDLMFTSKDAPNSRLNPKDLIEIQKSLNQIFQFIPDASLPKNPHAYVKSMNSSLNAFLHLKKLFPEAKIDPAHTTMDVFGKIDIVANVPQGINTKPFKIFINLKSRPHFRTQMLPVRSQKDISRIDNKTLHPELERSLEYFNQKKSTGDMLFFMYSPSTIESLENIYKNEEVSMRRVHLYNYVKPEKIRSDQQTDTAILFKAAYEAGLIDDKRLANDVVKAKLQEALGTESITYITAFCLKLMTIYPELQNVSWLINNNFNKYYWQLYFKPAIQELKKSNEQNKKKAKQPEIPTEQVDIQQNPSTELATFDTKEEEPAIIDVTEYTTETEQKPEEEKQLPSVITKIAGRKQPETREEITFTQTLLTFEGGTFTLDKTQSRIKISPRYSIQEQAELFAGTLQDLVRNFVKGNISQQQLRNIFAGLHRLDPTPELKLIRSAVAAIGDDGHELLSQIGRARVLELGYLDIDTCDAERITGYIRDSMYHIMGLKRQLNQTVGASQKNAITAELYREYGLLGDIIELVSDRCKDYSDSLDKPEVIEAILSHAEADYEELPIYVRQMIRLLDEDDYGSVAEILEDYNDRRTDLNFGDDWYGRDRLKDEHEDLEDLVATRGINSIIQDTDEYYFPLNHD